MKFWLQYTAKHVVLLLMLLASALLVLRYPSMWDTSASHMAAWTWMPMWAFGVTRALLPVGFAFGWVCYFVASRRVGRPQ
jgi:hypothetical protein